MMPLLSSLFNTSISTAAAMAAWSPLFGKIGATLYLRSTSKCFLPIPDGPSMQGGGHGRHSRRAVTLLALETTLQATESMHEKQNRHIS